MMNNEGPESLSVLPDFFCSDLMHIFNKRYTLLLGRVEPGFLAATGVRVNRKRALKENTSKFCTSNLGVVV